MFFVGKMEQNLNLVIAVVGSIVFISCCQARRDVVFVEKPQNRTILDLTKPFFFNCSTDIASTEGIDWTVRIDGNHERICLMSTFYSLGDNSCPLNYSMEVPNNRTLNLIVDPKIASLGDEYCCQFDNGAGKKSCSYLTIPPTTEPTSTDSTTAVFSLMNTTALKEAPAKNTGLIVGIVVGTVVVIVVIIIIAYVVWKMCKHVKERPPATAGHASADPTTKGLVLSDVITTENHRIEDESGNGEVKPLTQRIEDESGNGEVAVFVG